MNLPPVNIGNMDIKLTLGDIALNVLYVNFGYTGILLQKNGFCPIF